MSITRLERCSMYKKDCVALVDGCYCKALSDTNFGGKNCPFYMNEQQRNERCRNLVRKVKQNERRR